MSKDIRTIALDKQKAATTERLRSDMLAAPFGQHAARIEYEATVASGDAVRELYLRDNPNHIGMGEAQLKSAEYLLEKAIFTIRKLRVRIEQEREARHMEAAE